MTFELRQKSDYREFVQITREQAQQALKQAEAFLEQTRRGLAAAER